MITISSKLIQLPERLNYLLWIQDLLTESARIAPSDGQVTGIDMYASRYSHYVLYFILGSSWKRYRRFGHLSTSWMPDCTFLELCRHRYVPLALVRFHLIAFLCFLLFCRDWFCVVCVCCGERRYEQSELTHTCHACNPIFSYSRTPSWTYGFTVSFLDLRISLPLYISDSHHIILYNLYRYTFTMCNPPFYSSKEDISRSAEGKALEPSSVCTGADVEMITPGGEEAFVGEMVKESMKEDVRRRCLWVPILIFLFLLVLNSTL